MIFCKEKHSETAQVDGDDERAFGYGVHFGRVPFIKR
jgi:hypothetical protein